MRDAMKHTHKKDEQKDKDGLYWTPIGGNNPEYLSGNCHVYSCKHTHKNGEQKSSAILIDAGRYDLIEDFSGSGFDAIVPNALPFLNQAEAIFLTHAHKDHIEAIPEYIKMGYKLPKIYAASYTETMVKKTLAKHRIPIDKWPEMETIEAGKTISIGDMNIEAVAISHSIPDALGFAIKTPDATIFHSGDYKADQTLAFGKPTDFKRLEEISKDGVDAMMVDATTAACPDFAQNEANIQETYKRVIKEHSEGKVIVASAPHHLNRITSIAKAAAESGRTVIIDGGSELRFHMIGLKEAGIDLTKEIKGLKIIDGKSNDAKKLPPEKTLIITTAGWGQKEAPLYKAAKDDYDGFNIATKDTIIIDAFGKEWINNLLKDIEKPLKAKGVKIITGDDEPSIYGSGHGQKEDIKILHKTVKPKITIPMHCNDNMCQDFLKMAKEESINTGDIIPENGMTFRITEKDGVENVFKEHAVWIGVRSVSEGKSKGIKIPQKVTKQTKNEKSISRRAVTARKTLAELKTKKKITVNFHAVKSLNNGR